MSLTLLHVGHELYSIIPLRLTKTSLFVYMNDLKIFTLNEANQLLPVLKELLLQLLQKRRLATDLEIQIDALELIAASSEDASSKELHHLADKHRELVSEFYAVVDQIHQYGCFLKDPDLGLIDFYGFVNKKPVYYCWRLGEKEIGYWHEIGHGYANRQPLIHNSQS